MSKPGNSGIGGGGGSGKRSEGTSAPSLPLTGTTRATFASATLMTQSEHQDAVKRLSSPSYDDGTYNLSTLTMVDYPSGYQVTFCQIGDTYNASEYMDKVNEFLSVSSDGIASAGKFGGEPEVSFHVDDRATAVRLAKKYNQISVWDWAAGDEIKTGGTGRRA